MLGVFSQRVEDPIVLRKRNIIVGISFFLFFAGFSLLVFAGIVIMYNWYTFEDLTGVITGSVIGILISCIILAVSKFASVELASICLVGLLLATSIFIDTPYHVSHGRSIMLFVMPILLAGVLIRPGASFIMAVISSLVISLISIQYGLGLPHFPSIIGFFFVAVLAWIAVTNSERNTQMLTSTRLDLMSQRDRAKFLLDIMGHDIRNKLQAIFIGLELLETDNDIGQAIIVEKALSAATKCKEIITKAEKTEEINQTPLSLLDVSELMVEKVNNFRVKYPDIDITLNCEPKEIYTWVDKHFETLLENLMENAIEHNPRRDKKIWVNLEKAGKGVLIRIADNGRGISIHRKHDLLNPDKRHGGIGLHQSKHIIQKYNGSINIDDRIEGDPSSGLEVRIWIPEATLS
ncbi:MAG: putative Histidine kinase [Candidatus Thorarchaeota archaeon]|nr:MAG: putative Histidine kinase [Candidatus Thorarchaeota archaeon]